MSEALYAVVFTPEQHHTLMQLIDKGQLQPTNSFHVVLDPEELEFAHLVDGKPRDDKQATIIRLTQEGSILLRIKTSTNSTEW